MCLILGLRKLLKGHYFPGEDALFFSHGKPIVPMPAFHRFSSVGGGGQIGQIFGPFMITRGLSCDRVEFGHFFGGGGGRGQMTPRPPPPPPFPWLRAWSYKHRAYMYAGIPLHSCFIPQYGLGWPG